MMRPLRLPPAGTDGGRPLSGAALLSLAAAVGFLVGARAIVALELPRMRSLLGVDPIPREGLGMLWSARAVWPADLQESGLERVAGVLAALLLAGVAVALLNALVLVGEAGTARRRELAVRSAVGAGPGALLALLVRQIRALLLMGAATGVLLGMVVGGALRAGWPGVLEEVGWSAATGTVLPATMAVLAMALLAYLRTGVAVGRRGALSGILAGGGRSGADPGDAFWRRAVSAGQMGLSGAVALAALALAGADGVPGDPVPDDDRTVVLTVRAPAQVAATWGTVLADLDAVEGLELASVSSPGALLGLGVRDVATAQCGACSRGGLPLPVWGARADHHAISPGFLEAAGLELVAGRPLTPQDGDGGARVALVNRTFANAAFEKGDPLGRSVRLGRGLDDWYEVVGVVEDQPVRGLGGDDVPPAVVYVSALQHPVRHANVVLRGTEDSVASARALLRGAGVLEASRPSTLGDLTRAAGAPLAWASTVASALALVSWLLALVGAHATTLQVTQRRTRELAVRRALGATTPRVVAHVLGGSLRTAFWGVAFALFSGTLAVALLRKAVPLPSLDPAAYLAMALLLMASALLGSLRATRVALRVAPAEVLG